MKLYDGKKYVASFYEAHKGMLLTEMAQHDDADAEKELQVVLALLRDNRSTIREERNRNSFFDLEQDAYDAAIDFEFSRGEHERAFDYSEVSRARSLFDLMHGGAEIGDDDPDVVPISNSEPATHADIRRRMPDGVEILQYAVLQDKLLTWIISKDKFQGIETKISSDELTEIVSRYSQLVSSVSDDTAKMAQHDGVELYKILIARAEPMLDKHKRICVIPDKVLNRLPFNALISPSNGKYLITDYTFSFAPSSNVFVEASDEARHRGDKKTERLLSAGGTIFDHDAFPTLADLPSSADEARQIANLYHADALIGEQATKERVLSESGNADVVNIASHYVIDEHNPMLSKLLLSGSAGRSGAKNPSDGVLHAYEIYKTRLPNTRLVVLSACRTGVERYYSGEGMIGMSRTFLAARVPLVAASLWPVSASTADLITNFHRYRKQNSLSSVDALRQAQLDMLNDSKGTYNQPYYWAGFVLIGGNADF